MGQNEKMADNRDVLVELKGLNREPFRELLAGFLGVRPEEEELNVTKAPARIGSSPIRWTREPGRGRPSGPTTRRKVSRSSELSLISIRSPRLAANVNS